MADEQETPTFRKGQNVAFKGYAQMEEGFDAILVEGESLTIDSITDDGSLVVYSQRKDEDGAYLGDTVFPEEVELIETDETQGEGTEEVAEEPAKKTRKKRKMAREPKTEVEVVEDETPAPKATTKKKATPKKKVVDTEALAEEVEQATNIVVITDTESVTAILDESEDAIAAAKSLVEQSGRTDFTFGGVLYHIYSEGIHKGVTNAKTGKPYEGKRGFSEFVETELGVQYRKAMYLISMYTTFRQLDIDEEKLQEIGWSKAKELIPIAKLLDEDGNNIGLQLLKDNFDNLIEYAEGHTRDDLVTKIRDDYINPNGGSTTGERVNRTKYVFVLVGEQANVVNDAMAEARTKVEADNDKARDNAAFELICGEWAMLNADMDLDQTIAMIQNKFGVELAVVQADAQGDAAPEQEQAEQVEAETEPVS